MASDWIREAAVEIVLHGGITFDPPVITNDAINRIAAILRRHAAAETQRLRDAARPIVKYLGSPGTIPNTLRYLLPERELATFLAAFGTEPEKENRRES